MSRVPPVRPPGFWRVFVSWVEQHKKLSVAFFFADIFAPSLLQLYIPPYMGQVIPTLVIAVIILIIFLALFRQTVWKQQATLISWYGVCRNQETHDNIILCHDSESVLSVVLYFGPAVRAWTVRIEVPKECKLMMCYSPSGWKTVISKQEGIACQSAVRTDSNVHFAFHLQANECKNYVPRIRICLKASVNLESGRFPSNVTNCKGIECKELPPFTAVIVPRPQ